MNVLFLSNTPILGGTSRILQQWLQLGRGNGLAGSLVLREGSHFINWSREQGFPVLVDPMPWPSRRAPWSAMWHARRVAQWARELQAHAIHCNEHDVYPFARLLRRWLKLPMVCHVRYKLERKYAEWAFRGQRAPDVLLWTSHQQKSDSAPAIAGLVPEERQHVVPLGVDVANFSHAAHAEAGRKLRRRWGIGEDEVLVGLPSPLRPRKRIHDFVELITRLSKQEHHVVGIIAGDRIAGDEDYCIRIERSIAESGLGRRLQWVGYLDPVEPFHHACDISVSTSEYETFGNSVCEAMACGKPVAAYRGGSVAEVVGDAGLVVPNIDLDALTNAVSQLVSSQELRRSLGERGRARVETEFNPRRSLRQLESIYESITCIPR